MAGGEQAARLAVQALRFARTRLAYPRQDRAAGMGWHGWTFPAAEAATRLLVPRPRPPGRTAGGHPPGGRPAAGERLLRVGGPGAFGLHRLGGLPAFGPQAAEPRARARPRPAFSCLPRPRSWRTRSTRCSHRGAAGRAHGHPRGRRLRRQAQRPGRSTPAGSTDRRGLGEGSWSAARTWCM